ncbi:IclR family transcriptional regulator domain-containing protein [Pseudarthrobacter sp. S9]|uniref:IclR family transcriptional regulator domain-containing protein n=1 Tax=Pseudarthrobacter sp. S9 TaxID=3418421 RepID=UPI003D05E47A
MSGHRPSKIQTFEDLCAEIALIRRRGYAVVDEEFELGVVGVSAPVYDFKQRIVAAFNVSAPKQRFGRHLEKAGALAAKVAMDFSAALGAPVAPLGTPAGQLFVAQPSMPDGGAVRGL